MIFDVQVKDNYKVVESIQTLRNKSKHQSIQQYILRTCFHESGELITKDVFKKYIQKIKKSGKKIDAGLKNDARRDDKLMIFLRP